jgi:probable addiction module antidote protein
MKPKTTPFDLAEHLQSDEDIAQYLSLVIEEGDPGELAHALGLAARARGMAQIAKDAGIGREALYKALRADASPRFDTIARVCKALGVKLTVVPDTPGAPGVTSSA